MVKKSAMKKSRKIRGVIIKSFIVIAVVMMLLSTIPLSFHNIKAEKMKNIYAIE